MIFIKIVFKIQGVGEKRFHLNCGEAIFVERNVNYSASLTFLVGWHASAVSLPTGNVTFA